MNQIFTDPNLVYEVILNLDYPSIINLCKINTTVASICQNHTLVKSAIFQKYVDDYVKESKTPFGVLLSAAREGDLPILDELIRRGIDPSAERNFTVPWASFYGHLNVIDRLLQDPRVDPSVTGDLALQWASEQGHLDVVNRLLQDPRIDPSAHTN